MGKIKNFVQKRNKDITEQEKRNYFLDGSKIIQKIRESYGKILIITDYDVDGICSSLIWDIIMKSMGKKYEIYVPRRFSDGYGLSETILDKISGDLIITVDNGIAAISAIQKAKNVGSEVIVIDHHLPAVDKIGNIILPKADIILDPEAGLGVYDFQHYCGAGLSFKILEQCISDPMLVDRAKGYAAIATIADMVPLVYDNRKIVKEGLKLLSEKKGTTDNINHLFYRAYIQSVVTTKNIEYDIAPVLNSLGRLYDEGGQYVYTVLSYPFNNKIKDNIDFMFTVNDKRKELTKRGVQVFENIIYEKKMEADGVLTLYCPDIPEGIAGLIAGKISEEFKRPSIIVTNSRKDPKLLKGSGRSYGDIDLKHTLDQCQDILFKYGGHKAAAGLSFETSQLETVRKRLNHHVPFIDHSEDVIKADIVLPNAYHMEELYREYDEYGPFGVGNPEPLFEIQKFSFIPEFFGKNKEHLKMKLDRKLEAILFFGAEEYKAKGSPLTVSIKGTLDRNYYCYEKNGRIISGYNNRFTVDSYDDPIL